MLTRRIITKHATPLVLYARCNFHHLKCLGLLKLNTIRHLSTESNESNTINKTKSAEIPLESRVAKKSIFDEEEDGDDVGEDYEKKSNYEKALILLKTLPWIGLLALGGVCIYFTVGELFPGRMSPTNLYSEVFEIMKHDERIIEIVGATETMKAFGRDFGSNVEGRRNLVDSYQYENPADESKRLRIRFNIKGSKGQVTVWTEVSNKLSKNEFVYLICKDNRTRRVLTIIDQRDEMAKEENRLLAEKEKNNKFQFKIGNYFPFKTSIEDTKQ